MMSPYRMRGLVDGGDGQTGNRLSFLLMPLEQCIHIDMIKTFLMEDMRQFLCQTLAIQSTSAR